MLQEKDLRPEAASLMTKEELKMFASKSGKTVVAGTMLRSLCYQAKLGIREVIPSHRDPMPP